MKCVILAGGRGSRLAEETDRIPKPMVEIGGRPILWHIMKIYAEAGVTEFIICLGYRGYVIKEYFANYHWHISNVMIDLKSGDQNVLEPRMEDWKISLIDTGDESMTGGRLARVMHLLQDDDCFCMTYGDGVADIDISKSIAFHRGHGKLATVTAVPPPSRFGQLVLDGSDVVGFTEKPKGCGGLINGGFFVLSPDVANYLDGDDTIWEQEPLQQLAKDNQLQAYEHQGFWQPMDTIRERNELEDHWATGNAPWRIWS